jgi:hypothetical protein
MTICFVNYCTDKPSSQYNWTERGISQTEQAYKHGATEVHNWNEEMLYDTQLYKLHRKQFDIVYVAGFIWKPYVILQSLITTKCDHLLYLDCDLEIVDDIHKFTDHLEEQDVVIPTSPWLHGQFMKREAAILLGADTKEYYNLQQLFGNLMAFKNSDIAKKFLLDWLIFSLYPDVSTYEPSIHIEEHPNYHMHRNQGGLTVLYHQYGFKQYPEELIDITNLRAQGGATLVGYTVERWE